MSTSPSGDRLTKNERREQARESARIQREEQRKKDKRNKILLQGGIILGVLGVAALVVVLIVTSIRPAGPGPNNMASGGIQFTSGFEVTTTAPLPNDADPIPNPTSDDTDVLDIQMYADYFCPICNAFEQTNQEYINTLVESGAATLEVFPVAILDRVSLGTKYSTRSANAAACVADTAPDSFMDFHAALFANQPAEQTSGLDNAQLIELASAAGADSDAIAECINGGTFTSFVTAMTTAAINNPDLASPSSGGFGTPTVIVNGQRYDGAINDAEAFRAFLVQVAGEAFVQEETATSTPTPTATETPAP